MLHVQIAFYVITLLVGLWTLAQVIHHARAHGTSWIKAYAVFILSHNILVLTSLMTQYTCTNILGNAYVYCSSLVQDLFSPTGALIFIGMHIAWILTVLAMMEVHVPHRLKKISLALLFIPLIGIAVIGFISPAESTGLILRPLHRGYYYVSFVSFFFMLILLTFYGFRRAPVKKRIPTLTFAVFYLLAYALLIVATGFPPRIQIPVSAVILLLFNIFPLVYLWKFYPVMRNATLNTLPNDVELNRVLDSFHISRRERDIARLILQGKSNKEIQDTLFISLRTVKNHVYNMYKKVGAKSRGQFIYLILQSQERA